MSAQIYSACSQLYLQEVWLQKIDGLFDGKVVPDKAVFQKVIDALLKKQGAQGQTRGIGRTKCRTLQYCIAEATRKRARQALREADAACIMQDCRKGRLQVRFSICDHRLQARRGVLGEINLAKHFDLSAEGVKQGMLHVCKIYCTTRINDNCTSFCRHQEL